MLHRCHNAPAGALAQLSAATMYAKGLQSAVTPDARSFAAQAQPASSTEELQSHARTRTSAPRHGSQVQADAQASVAQPRSCPNAIPHWHRAVHAHALYTC